MRHLVGATFLVVLACLNACRTSNPPPFEIICTASPAGGGGCTILAGSAFEKTCIKDDTKPSGYFCPPMAMENFWCTSQADMARFSAWAYDADQAAVTKRMADMEKEMGSAR